MHVRFCLSWRNFGGARQSNRMESEVFAGTAAMLYVVHMKHVTASEARKNWFKLLDEASNGETIAINRNGKNLALRLQTGKKREKLPDYSKIIRAPDADNANKWGWKWTKRRGVIPVTKK